jgi:hypothetical protein
MTGDERRALESELANCRQELAKYESAARFWDGAEADDGSNVLIRAESMIFHYQGRIAEIEALFTRAA